MPLENSGLFRVFTAVACVVGGGYTIFLADYGDKENVFSPVCFIQ
jgi:hypothetical protein